MEPLVERLKSKHSFDSWRGTSRLDDQLLVWRFFLGGSELAAWRPERIGLLETAEGPRHLRSIWRRREGENDSVLVVDTFECADRLAAHESLIEALAGFQSADVAPDEERPVGDVAFSIPTRSFVLFARANLVIHVRNGGRDIIPVSDPAAELDRVIASRPSEPGQDQVAPKITRFELPREVAPGADVPIDIEAVDPLARPVWFKFFARSGDLRLEQARPIYRAPDAGADILETYAINENLGSARRSVEVTMLEERDSP